MKKSGKFICLWFFVTLPITGFSQEKGIQFEHGLTWKEVQVKAKAEKKYILIDCYATWCGPCKLMDKNVYPNDSVGDYINANFISVQVQMDTSKTDEIQTKEWYHDAHVIKNEYQVSVFPTFLFLSPEGKLVHKGIGYTNIAGFIAFSEDALNPKRQYFTLLGNYKKGQRDFPEMAYLARTAYSFNEKETGLKIARDYIDHYLSHLNKSQLYTKENIEFISDFTKGSKDKGFKLLYLYADKINKIMGDPMYSQPLFDYIISKEEIDPEMITAMKDSSTPPDWRKISFNITRKYNKAYADRNIAAAKSRWYGWKKDWRELTKYSVQYIEIRWPNISNDELNDYVYDRIFQYSTDKKEIESAIRWMAKVVETETDSANALPAYMDTYANLLYKFGKKEEAIQVEESALKIAIDHKSPNFPIEARIVLEKIKNGSSSWLVPSGNINN